jgi:2-keto-4-pentenoate hydratase/2-oxohepta-3-ene-1,7-dioic acid hydratase in catechol pathway
MGINICRYRHDNTLGWGVIQGNTIHHVGGYDTLEAFLMHGKADAFHLDTSGAGIDMGAVELLSPVTPPCSIVCQGLNYDDHRKESGVSTRSRPPFNMMFTKASSSLNNPHGDIVRPEGVQLLDYELELGLIIGREIKGPIDLTEEAAADHIAGIVMTNDVSARDVQIPQQQWFKGKSFRTFCPVGPFIHLFAPGEFDRLRDIDIRLEVNGRVRQEANTRQLLFQPSETLHELSGIMDLHPGDLIMTGTPGGVALNVPPASVQRLMRFVLGERLLMKMFLKNQRTQPHYLQDGDVITSTMRSPDGTIDLGIMRQRVVAGT